MVTILHVSDVHFGLHDSTNNGPIVTDALIRAAHAADWKPDLCVFSGDRANKGKPEELDLGRAWLAKLVAKWNCPLAIVPGNHDLDRSAATKKVLRAASHHADAYDDWREDLRADTTRFAEFLTRFQNDGVSGDIDLFLQWDDALFHGLGKGSFGGTPVTVIGLNTALLSCDDHDAVEGKTSEGKLVVDLASLNAALSDCTEEELVLVVGHHPTVGWLAPWNARELRVALGRKTKGAHAWLHGHVHDADAVYHASGRGSSLATMMAGATYQNQKNYPLFFACYEFQVEDDQVRVETFKYLPTPNAWRLDPELSDTFPMALPGPKASRKSGRATRTEAAPPTSTEGAPPQLVSEIEAYLGAQKSLHKDVRLAGFESMVRVPVLLEDLYVPLHAIVDTRALESGGFGGADDAAKSIGAGGGEDSEIDLTDALRRADAMGGRRAVVLLGDPGAGKTTLLKRLLLLAIDHGSDSLGLPPDMVPVYLPLRDLKSVDEGFEDLLERALSSPHLKLKLPTDFSRKLLKRGKLLFLLDGLDEVPSSMRADVSYWIDDAVRMYDDCHFAVTCRYAGYRAKNVRLSSELLELHLRPLGREQAEQFVHNWFRIVERALHEDSEQAESIARENAEELVDRLREPDFRARRVFELTRNPLLLTAICLVHRDRGRLPRRRAELYSECINVLLERWRSAKGLGVDMGASSARQILGPVALWMHGHEEKRTRASLDELEPVVDEGLATVEEGAQAGPAKRFLETIRDESGLLTGWSGDSYGFMHLGFQEYLTAQAIRGRAFGSPAAVEELASHFGESWWREVTLLLLALEGAPLFEALMRAVVQLPAFAEHPDLVDECLDDALQFSPEPFVELLESDPGADEELWMRQLAALRALEQKAPARLDELREALGGHPLPEIARRTKPVVLDLHATETTSSVGQARLDVLPNRIVAELGEYELVLISTGEFRMGSPPSEKGHVERESPQHSVKVPSFYLGVHPVTNEQYARFLWESSDVEAPSEWGNRGYNQPRQPVVGVCWDDARLYCEWAGLILLTEAQWEYACRAGTESRYWSGDAESDLARVGWYDENSEQRLHPVGEKEVSPFGLVDMHGNVWEWCQDSWSYNYSKSQRVHPGAFENAGAPVRVYRGGCFLDSDRVARSAFRVSNGPSYRSRSLGCRPARASTP